MIQYPRGYSKQTINSFSFLIYEDSALPNWIKILEELQVQAIISPLHDKDVNEDGTPKKPHYHVIVFFSGGKSESFCQGILDEVGAANGIGKVCRSLEASVRYLVHLGSIDKFHYNPDDIICLGGCSIRKYFSDVEVEDVSTVTQVINYIKSNKYILFCDFVDYCITDKPSWLRAMRSTWFSGLVKEYIKSHYERCHSFFLSHVD